MKRILVTGLSALTLAGSFASTASAQDFGRYDHQNDGRDGRGDNRDNDRNRGDQRGNWDNRGDNDRRGGWNNDRFDRQFNRHWRRGDRLPYGWQNRYRDVDYRYYHMRPAPYGYRYVRDDSGRILLVGLATGVILSAIFNGY